MIQIDQGFSIVEGVFTRSDMAQVLEGLSAVELQRTKAGARHVLAVPVVQELALDPRMVKIATELVGLGAVPFRATLFDKSPSANWLVVWHQDTALPLRERFEDAAWGPWSSKAGVLYAHAPAWALEQVVALRVSLDDSWTRTGRSVCCPIPTWVAYWLMRRSPGWLGARRRLIASLALAALLPCAR
jgi:hypothetical protein